jgi:hypothetical protein
MDALHARFRDHTCRLFEKHGMTLIGFWTPLAQDVPQRLVYLLAYPSKEAADQSWNEFRDDADWQAARSESERDGSLLARPPESLYLTPTDYSPLK